MNAKKLPDPMFTTIELKSIMDRIAGHISKVITDEVEKKTEELLAASKTANKIMSMERADWIKIEEVARMFDVSENEVVSIITKANLPYLDSAGNVRRMNHFPVGISILRPAAIDKYALTTIAQSFNSRKGQVMRDYTAMAMIYTMQEASKSLRK